MGLQSLEAERDGEDRLGRSSRSTGLIALGLAGVAFVVVLLTTRGGMDVTTDSVSYVSIGRNLASGRGFVDFSGLPATQWPPGLSLLLAGGAKVGLSIETAARILNATAAAIIVWLTYVLGARMLPSKRWALLAAVLVGLAPSIVRIEDSLWTEAVFTVLVLGFVLILEAEQARPSLAMIAAAGATAGAATLVRYLGVAVVAAGIAVLVVRRPRSLRAAGTRAVVFLGAAALFVVPWLVHNLDAGTVAGGRSPSTPGLGPSLKALLVGLGQLMLGQVPQAVAIAAVAAGAILLAALWASARPSQHVPSAVLTCLITGGALVVVATIASIISASDVDQRILAPTVPLFVLSALWLFVQSGSRAPSLQARPAIRKAFVLTVVGLVVVGLAGLAQAWRHGESGRGFAAPSVRDSPVVRAARAVPLDTTIVTDDGLPIAYWTGRTRLLDIADSFEAAPAKVDDVARAACAGAATYLGTQPSATSSFQARARGRLAFVRLAAGSGVTRYQLAVINRASCATYGIGHR